MTGGGVLLVGTLAVPAIGAALVAVLPSRADRAARILGTVFAAVTFVGSLLLYAGRHAAGNGSPGGAGTPAVRPWYELDLTWVPGLDLRFHLGVDGLSYPLVVLTALLTLLCCGYTLWHVPGPGRGRTLVALLLVIEVGIVGTFLALDLVLFFVFFEVVLLPMYAVIAGWGGTPAPPAGDEAGPARPGQPGPVPSPETADPTSPLAARASRLGPSRLGPSRLGPSRLGPSRLGPSRSGPSRSGPSRSGASPHQAAARKFALYTLLGSVLLLVGVFTVVAAAGTADIVALTGGTGLGRGTQLAAFTLLALAFAVKSPLWPLHSWLPDAHTQAPTVGSVILAGVLLKMGTYGLIRVAVGVAPEGARWAAPVLGVLAVAAIIVGSLVCLAQEELKRLIAYSSVGHMGFVLLGIATLTATGIQAALIGNIAHGVITGLLFFLAGAVKDRAHTGTLADLRGLRETAPRLAGLLGFAAIASLGLPGLAGFWGEAFAVVAALDVGRPLWTVLGVLAAVGGALTAAYFLRLLRRVTHGRPAPSVARLSPGLAGAEVAAWAPLVLLALAIGLVPTLVLGVAGDPVQSLLEALR